MKNLSSDRVRRWIPFVAVWRAFSNSREKKDPKRTQPCLTLLRMWNGSDELPLNYTIPIMPLWKDSVMLCSLCWQPISGRILKVQCQSERVSLLARSNDLVSSLKAKENDICCSLRFFRNCQIVKWRRQRLLLSLQLGSQTLCKLLDADHEDTSKYFYDDGQKTEISISADGYFGEMKNTESWQVCRWGINQHDKISGVTAMLKELDWQPLELRRAHSRLCLPYTITNGFVATPHIPYLHTHNHAPRSSRHAHTLQHTT